jgi:hypothetical protein
MKEGNVGEENTKMPWAYEHFNSVLSKTNKFCPQNPVFVISFIQICYWNVYLTTVVSGAFGKDPQAEKNVNERVINSN